MKSPLVEALKQASNDDSAAQQEDTPATAADTAGESTAAVEPTYEDDALTLMDSMEMLPIDGLQLSIDAGPVDNADEHSSDSPPDASDPSEADTSEAPPAPELPSTEEIVRRSVASITSAPPRHAMGVARLGRFTPLIAVALLGTTAIGQVAYDHLGNRYGDSAIAPTEAISGTARNVDVSLPSAVQNPFPLHTRTPTTDRSTVTDDALPEDELVIARVDAREEDAP